MQRRKALNILPVSLMCAGLALGLAMPKAFGQEDWTAEPAAAADSEQAVSGGFKQTAVDTVDAVKQASADVGAAFAGGGSAVVEQGRKLWQEALLPSFQRTAAAIPMLLKGLLMLLVFWLIGKLLGAGVRRLLDMTKLDERAMRDWGLEGLLKTSDGETRSLSRLLGSVVKWVLVLFGVVAFFNAINLNMVAAPLQRVLDSIFGVIPNLLNAIVILLVYWAIASVVRVGITRGLQALKFDERAGRRLAPAAEGAAAQPPPSAMLGRLSFYIVLLFALPPLLASLGQGALVTPLQGMLGKALDFLPNIVAAGIILLVGRIIASIVKEVVGNLLAASGLDQTAEKMGIGKVLGARKVSGITATIVYFFVLIPIIVAAIDSLGIKVISDPIKATLESVLAAIPAMLVATVIVIIGCLIAKVLRSLVTSLLAGVGFDNLPERLNLNFMTPKAGQTPLSGVVGAIVAVVIILITAQQAAASLKFMQLADLVRQVVEYLPSLVVGLLIMLVALSLSKYVGNLIEGALKGHGNTRLLSIIARCAITLLGAGMALEQLGVGQEIVTVAIAAILGGAALALGLSFGLGGKDRAKEIVERWSRSE